MAWIKRNLFFFIGGILALGLLGAAGYYNYKGWSDNAAAFKKLNDIYTQLHEYATKKPSPGNDKVNNTEAARQQEQQIEAWTRQAATYFKPIASIPDTGSNAVTSEAFAASLRRTIDQMQHEADLASVMLPPQYSFSFTEQRSLVKFDPAGLAPLAEQLGEVKSIAEVFFAARVNSLDSIQRVRVSADDAAGPQSDYFDDHSISNNLAVLTPYQVTFRSFSTEVGEVLAGFASSPHAYIVTSINVQPAGAYTGSTPEGAAPPMSPPPPTAPAVISRGGLQTVLNEQLLRVTLEVDIVKLLPRK